MRPESRKKYWHRNHQLRLHRLYKEASDNCPFPVGWSAYCQILGSCHTKRPADGAYLKRYYRGYRSAYLKRLGAKRWRRNIDMASERSGYKKDFDFWWELT